MPAPRVKQPRRVPFGRARPFREGLFRERPEGRPGAPLSGQFRATLGAAPQSGPASAPSAVQYVEVRPAVRAPVIEEMVSCRGPKAAPVVLSHGKSSTGTWGESHDAGG